MDTWHWQAANVKLKVAAIEAVGDLKLSGASIRHPVPIGRHAVVRANNLLNGRRQFVPPFLRAV